MHRYLCDVPLPPRYSPGAGSSFYETSWQIPFSADPSKDKLENTTETKRQFANPAAIKTRGTSVSHGGNRPVSRPKTQSEIVLGELPAKQFMASTTQLDDRDKSAYSERRNPIVPSEDKETWRTARVGGTMQTSSSLHFPRRSIEESQRQQRAGAPRSVLREYNLINGSKYAAK